MNDINNNTENFIREMQKYPALWDSSTDEYTNKIEKRKAWNAIITHFIADFEEKSPIEKLELVTHAQKKWKGIRSSYTRELRKQQIEKNGPGASGRKQYAYFETLRYLETVTKINTSSLDESKDDDIDDSSIDKMISEEIELQNPPKKSKIKKEGNDDIEALIAKLTKDNQEKENERNEDKLFLLSLVSELKKVPADRKLQVKANMLHLISQAQVDQQPFDVYAILNLCQNLVKCKDIYMPN